MLLSHNVMAVDPNSLALARRPVTWPPYVVGAAYVITGTAHIVRPVANCDRHRAGITAIIRTASIIRAAIIRAAAIIRSAIVRSVPRIPGVIVRTSAEPNRGTN